MRKNTNDSSKTQKTTRKKASTSDPLNHTNPDIEAKIVAVIWNDAAGHEGWSYDDGLFESMAGDRAVTIGMVAREDEDSLYLQSSMMCFDNGFARGGVSKLPKGMIDKVIPVRDIKIKVRKD